MKTAEAERKGHAVLDLPSRNYKAMKIARLLGVAPGGGRLRMLEIGCGSGGISHWFGAAGPMGWEVVAVDVEDVRLVFDGFTFQIVAGTLLPFHDGSFDVVLTNHVIEHVGDEEAQRRHLREVRRVLKAEGQAFLAVPNRWMFIEPHFGLPMLSWLPRHLANLYVQAAGKGSHYDCRPLTCARLERLLRDAGFSWRQHTAEALHILFEIERADAKVYKAVLRRIPNAAYLLARRLFPTLLYTLSPRS